MLCRNCDEPILYREDLQSWRHISSGYDACGPVFGGRIYATPISDGVTL